jgi:protein-S-isoprenylcysteine O-methyltransferase Ste14
MSRNPMSPRSPGMGMAPGRDPVDAMAPRGTAGVVVRPPLLFLGALALGFALEHLLPVPYPIARTGPLHWISAYIALGLIVVGIVLFAASIRNFARAGTPVPGTRATTALVTTGIHGWSRNPIYIGMFLIYAGIGLVTRKPWVLILLLPVSVTIRYHVVALEEAYLERRFGDAYRDYKARVRRWL